MLAVQLAELRAVLRWLDMWRHVMEHVKTVIAAHHSFLPGLLEKLAVRYTLRHASTNCVHPYQIAANRRHFPQPPATCCYPSTLC